MVDAELESAARDRLKEAGMRITRPRLAVVAALDSLGGHRTADDVHDHLVTAGEELPRTSVYNALSALCAAGVATTADVGAGAAAYELASHWHHHFVCRVCRAVMDVDCLIGEKPCLTPVGDFGSVDEAQVIFRGVCLSCAAAARSAADPASSAAADPASRLARGRRSHGDHTHADHGHTDHVHTDHGHTAQTLAGEARIDQARTDRVHTDRVHTDQAHIETA